MDNDWTDNEVTAAMYDNTVIGFRAIADHIEKWKWNWEETVKFLRESADEQEAQAIVVRLRDKINPQNP